MLGTVPEIDKSRLTEVLFLKEPKESEKPTFWDYRKQKNGQLDYTVIREAALIIVKAI